MLTIKDFINSFTCEKKYIDTFLDDTQPNWAQFDPELGYTLKTCSMKDGIDDSYTQGSFLPSGERVCTNYKEKTCRINTYGNSFTQCHQVSDCETWQEYLAGHLCEPIRNFGIGGYGVWQAYKRLLRHESNPEQSSEYVIFNIFSDDHYRSVDRWRWIRIEGFRNEIKNVSPNYFHATPWSHIRLNPQTREWEEHDSLCPKKEDLYRLCDASFLYNEFKDDLIVHLEEAKAGNEFCPATIQNAAELVGMSCDFSTPEAAAQTAVRVHDRYALSSTVFIIRQLEKYCKQHNKKLLLVLSYAAGELFQVLTDQPRFDQYLLDYIAQSGIPCLDLAAAHREDLRNFCIEPQEYIKRYYIYGFGHYTPAGNHFCAYKLKDMLVNMLEPKPLPYRLDKQNDSAKLASRLA